MLKNVSQLIPTATVLAISTGLSATALPEPSACQDDGLSCFFSDRGVVISKAATIGNELAVMEEAAQRYERYFGKRPNPGVIISGEAVNSVDVTNLIRKDGYHAVVPWLSNADRRRLAEYHVRTQIKEQMPDISEERLEKSVKASLAAMETQTNAGSQETEDGALAHELSHMWFISEYWPDDFAPGNTPAAYGGPATDWLDEMAAVLAENDRLTERRWKHFAELDVSDPENGFYPLAEYFTMDHPMAETVQADRDGQGETGNEQIEIEVRVMTRDDIEATEGRDPTIFYTQSRAFADFLIATTQNERIFALIAAHIAKGGSMESWLKTSGNQHKLPASINGLDTMWQAWLKALPQQG